MEGLGTTLEHRMLNDTLGAFGDGRNVQLSAEQGTLLLEGWLNALPGDVGAERILAEITALRDHLKSGHIDGEKVRHWLLSMASHTLTLSHEPVVDDATATQLHQLANALRNFTNQIWDADSRKSIWTARFNNDRSGNRSYESGSWKRY